MAGTAANVIVAGATLSVGGTDVGFTRGGISIRVPRDYRDVEANQQSTLVKKVAILTRAIIRATLMEPTLSNLKYAWDQAGTGSIVASTNVEVACVIVGTAAGGAARTITLARCVSIGEGEYSLDRTEENTVEVEFEALTTNGSFGTISA